MLRQSRISFLYHPETDESHVFGYGVQKEHTTYYRGVETDADRLPKVGVEVVISNLPKTVRQL